MRPVASSTYDTIVRAVEEYLNGKKCNGPEKIQHSSDIIKHIRKKIEANELSVDATDGTILSYISTAANSDANSGIKSGGPHRGYWYEPLPPEGETCDIPEKEVVKLEKGQEIDVREKDLYPLVELWLQQKGYKSKDMSTLKSGGKWGNPDIIGADRVELFGAVDIDLASCEVKLSADNWQQFIFEAISHKRFSNRSWFCYRVSNDGEAMPKGMMYYAERYRVGIVQLVLSDNELGSLKAEKVKPLDLIENVVECVPALYDTVPLREQRDLVDRSGITLNVTF